MVEIVRKSNRPNYYIVGTRVRGPYHGFAVHSGGKIDLYYYDYTDVDLEKSVDLDQIPYVHVGPFRTMHELQNFVIRNPNAGLKNYN